MGALGPNLPTAHNVVLSEHDITLMAERAGEGGPLPPGNITNHGFLKTSDARGGSEHRTDATEVRTRTRTFR